MIRERRNQVLIGLAVLQILLVVLVFWPRPAGGQGEPLLPNLTSEEVVALTVTDPGGKSLTLRQVEGLWVLPEFDDYPAQSSKVTLLLEQVAGLTTAELVGQTAAAQKQLKVAENDFVHRLDLQKADGTTIRLYLGTSPRLNGTHVRVEGQMQTYLGVGLSTSGVDARPVSWVDTLYFSLATDQVQSFRLQNANGVFSFHKGDDGKWSMAGLQEGETLDSSQVETVLRQATSVRLQEPLGKEKKAEYGMDEPAAVVVLETAARTITLTVGPADEAKSYHVVISSQSPYYVRVSAASVRQLVEKDRRGFLVPPPTATPTPQVTATPAISPTEGLVSGIGFTGTLGITSGGVITGTPGTQP